MTWWRWARTVGLLLAVTCLAFVLARPAATREGDRWGVLAVACILATAAQIGVRADGAAIEGPAGPPTKSACWRGGLLAMVGAFLWVVAAWSLQSNWALNFDRGWMAWLTAVVLMGIGLDAAWASWEHPGQRRWRVIALYIAAVAIVAGIYRLGSFVLFPATAHIVKIEELQNGSLGVAYLHGARQRWEFIGHAWLAALGIWLGGPSLLSMRLPFTIVSALKVVPLFLWLYFVVGTVGAVVGSALFACSLWDVTLARAPSNPNALIVAVIFALLAGPARRGRPSAYVWLGFLGGWVLFEYVAYRPLALIVAAGATWVSLRDRWAGWTARLARPLITFVLIGTMAGTLALFLGGSGRGREYLDGWNRARAVTSYYRPDDTATQLVQKGLQRVFDAVSMFLFRGVKSPATNPASHAMLDPLTAALVVIGVAWSLTHAADPVVALTLLALGGGLFGGMVASGNFDPARASPTVPYVFALAGYGAAGVAAVLQETWGSRGRRVALVALTALVPVAAQLNGRFLVGVLTSPDVQSVQLTPLVYLSEWLRDHVRPGERVVGIAPGFFHVLGTHDAAWLRGDPMEGVVSWDVDGALRDWSAHPHETLLFVYSGARTAALKRYLEWALPGLQMEIDEDETGSRKGTIAYTHLTLPRDFAYPEQPCRGAKAEFELVGTRGQQSLGYTRTVVPFIDQTTWPGSVRKQVYEAVPKPDAVHARFRSLFRVTAPGDYFFFTEGRAGTLILLVDGQPVLSADVPRHLERGEHSLELKGRFKPVANEMMARVVWRGPDSGGLEELMPLYAIGRPDESCPSDG